MDDATPATTATAPDTTPGGTPLAHPPVSATTPLVPSGQRHTAPRTRHHSGAARIDYGPLEPILADRGVTEVMVNGHEDIWIEHGGQLHRTTLSFDSEDALRRLIDQIATFVGRRVNSDDATLDARLPDGSRVNVVLPPLSLSGPVVTIRRFPEEALTEDHLIELGSAPRAVFDFLHS